MRGASLDHLRSTWEELGRSDPLWAVLSDPARRGGRWDLDEFLRTGRGHAEVVGRMVAGRGLSLGERVLDFGCGVGRLSNALAELAPRVVGVDIAESMLEYARRVVRHPDRIRFVHYDGRSLPFGEDSFDSAVSLMVLQHARPAVQVGCLLELQRVVRPGGVLVLQIPSRQRRPEPLHPAAYRASIELLDVPESANPGQTVPVRVWVANASEHSWPADGRVNLGNHWWSAGEMVVRDDARAALPGPLEPGDSVELTLRATAPEVDGDAELEVDLVQEFVTWWAEVGNTTAMARVAVGDTPPNGRPADPAGGEPAEPAEDPAGGMEMHGMHVDLVRSLLTHCGCQVLEAVPDEMAGDDWESYTYLVRV